MEELHSSADSLIKTCQPEVSAQVETSVKETVQAWDEKTVQLEDLCKRYQQAVELWSRYKKASDAIASWSDELLHSVNDLPPEEALKVRFYFIYFIFMNIRAAPLLAKLQCVL